MNTLKFTAPVGCHNEVFSTARLGKKWQSRIARSPKVSMEDAAGNPMGTAEAQDIWVGPIGAVPAILLEQYHDPIGRTWSGLQALLQGTYDVPVAADTEITILRLLYQGGSQIEIAKPGVNGGSPSFGGMG